jgi:hypothetical protein
MDIKTAFLNGNIEEELYTIYSKGFVDLGMLVKYTNFSVPFVG